MRIHSIANMHCLINRFSIRLRISSLVFSIYFGIYHVVVIRSYYWLVSTVVGVCTMFRIRMSLDMSLSYSLSLSLSRILRLSISPSLSLGLGLGIGLLS